MVEITSNLTTETYESRKAHAKKIEAKEEKGHKDLRYLDFISLLDNLIDIAKDMERVINEKEYCSFESYCSIYGNEFLKSMAIKSKVRGESYTFLEDDVMGKTSPYGSYTLRQGNTLKKIFESLSNSIREDKEYNLIEIVEACDSWFNC